MAKKEQETKQPDRILIQEDIGWMEHGVLRQFREGQTVSNPADIAQLIAHGAQFFEVLS